MVTWLMLDWKFWILGNGFLLHSTKDKWHGKISAFKPFHILYVLSILYMWQNSRRKKKRIYKI